MSGNNIYAWMKIEEKYVVVLADLYYNKYKIYYYFKIVVGKTFFCFDCV